MDMKMEIKKFTTTTTLNADPDPAPRQNVQIFERWSTDPLWLYFEQCAGSVTFWYGSGSADPYL
jgi:hypothetical protein